MKKILTLALMGAVALGAVSCSGVDARGECDARVTPGSGVSFPVTAWFDNGSVPSGFTTGEWTYNGTTITVEYRLP